MPIETWVQMKNDCCCFTLTLLSLWLHLQRQHTVSLPIDDPLHEIISSLVSIFYEVWEIWSNTKFTCLLVSLMIFTTYTLRKKNMTMSKPVVCWERADWWRKGWKPNCHSHLHLNGILSNKVSLDIKQASYLCLARHAHLNKCLLCMLF